ncbi:MAG: hypothetical protein K8T91_05550 [Planctomycetes bacterium]|nr:hypothetical protein [Planctomycetota bacterium]
MASQNDHLRQQLLGMIQGLLSDVETAELRERICSDPEVARAYSEVSTEADAIAKAARLEGSKVELPKMQATRSRPAAWMPWVVYVALSLLVAVTLGGYVWDRSQRRDVSRDHMRLLVSGPATITPGVESRVTVRTESITGAPLPASIELSLTLITTDEKGTTQERQLLSSADRVRHSDSTGQPTEFIIPADLTFASIHGLQSHAAPSLRLEVLAHNGPNHARFSRVLSIKPEPQSTNPQK